MSILFYSIQYHIVWCVKYRRRVLLGEVEKDLKRSMIEIAGNYGVTIVEMETDQDHIHLLVECTPQHYIPDILKTLKGVSARRLFQLHRKSSKSFGADTCGIQAILWQQYRNIQKTR